MLRGEIGSRRVDHRLVDDVNISAIPIIRDGFEIKATAEYSIGGDAPKDLVLFDGFKHAYIAKKPGKKRCATRPLVGALECVTEYLISRVGAALPLRVAKGRLVRLHSVVGPQNDVRFMSRYFLNWGVEGLTHGLELVARCLDLTPLDVEREVKPGGRQEREFYTVDLIDGVLRSCAGENKVAQVHLQDAFARMMAFDGLVGANDRHPFNWGVIEGVLDHSRQPRFCPIYDTARGLFWNHTDETLQQKGERFVAQYADGSAPLISIEGAKDPSHFEVIDFMVNGAGAARFGASVRNVVHSYRPDAMTAMLHSKFSNILSRLRLQRVDELLRYRHARLISICRGGESRPRRG